MRSHRDLIGWQTKSSHPFKATFPPPKIPPLPRRPTGSTSAASPPSLRMTEMGIVRQKRQPSSRREQAPALQYADGRAVGRGNLSRSRERAFHICEVNISPQSDFTCPNGQISLELSHGGPCLAGLWGKRASENAGNAIAFFRLFAIFLRLFSPILLDNGRGLGYNKIDE